MQTLCHLRLTIIAGIKISLNQLLHVLCKHFSSYQDRVYRNCKSMWVICVISDVNKYEVSCNTVPDACARQLN